MPPSTSPVTEGEAGEACAYAPIQRARQHEVEACTLRLGVYARLLLSTSPGPSLLATGVPHQVGCARATTLCFECFRRFKLMFQVFNLNIAKVDLRC